ncbi:MAG: phosphatase PAP2 family protein [Patescibacteria group bacterium]|jgi:undecaprenyl-diphosphatase|nr:phosphatase PAP2 family protein [Patescibacteria group bacterium]
MNFDYLIFQKINNLANQCLWFDKLMIFLAEYLIYFMTAFGLIYLFFIYQKQWKEFIKPIIAIIFSRAIITEIIRFFYYRPRPFLTHQVNNLVSHDISGSFPSGHITFIFPLIYFVASVNKKIGLVFIVLGVLMGIARIYVGVHYPLDIVGGIIVGVFSAWFVEKISPRIKFLK